ncbi:hypothetical protein K8I85_13240 [bacterium]|nr:hypothetical protein [bacterium]
MSVIPSTQKDLYRRGVDLLVAGDAAGALRVLEPLVAEGDRSARLALAKAHLELEDGAAAAPHLAVLLGAASGDDGMRAYLHLLAASAASFAGRADDAERQLDAALEADTRLERSVRAFRRRLRKERVPRVRL